MARTVLALLLVLAGMPALASAERTFRHARIRQVEAGVTIQRGTETAAEEAVANFPYLPGDRVWTDGAGRAEFQFMGGTLLRLDSGSKLDYVAHEGGRDERIVLRLWSGSLFLDGDSRDGAFEIETPGGIVSAEGRGLLRVDASPGETRLSVFEGDARLEDQRVPAGERAFARDGVVEEPRGFDRAENDDFSIWNEGQDRQTEYAGGELGLPGELSIYEGELAAQGVWYNETGIGNVWRPHVGIGWRPYLDGRWTYTPYGWTWVPGERWGWATAHYGRWGYARSGHWYWIPQSGWGPAWVSWAVGGDYVGWCPLGYGNRPVTAHHGGFNNFGNRDLGRAVPRGATSSWTYARRGDLAARDLSRRRVDRVGEQVARELRVIENPHQARLTRELTVAPTVLRTGAANEPAGTGRDGSASPRAVHRKPVISDTVPELRADPMTTIPFPMARRRPRAEEEKDPADGEAAPESAARSFPRRRSTAPASEVPGSGEAQPPATPGMRRSSSFGTSEDERSRRRPRDEQGQTAEPTPQPDTRARERSRRGDDEERELRPLFRPLSRPRPDDAGTAVAPPPRPEPRSRPEPRYEPRPEPRHERPQPRVEPKAAPPPSQPPADASSNGRARARHRDRDQ